MATKKTQQAPANTTNTKPPQAVAKPNAGTAMVKKDEQALMAAMAQDSGSGYEEATRDAFAIPFLLVLQDLSPQTKKTRAEYVQGAKPGNIFHSITQELMDECTFIPCHYSQTFIEWIPRDKGGGFVAAHPATTPLIHQGQRDGARVVLPNGHELQDTRQHFGLLVRPDGSTDGCLIAMKSTQLKYSRRWMTSMKAGLIEVGGKLVSPPMWAWQFRLTTVEESNDNGTWYSWQVGARERVTNMDLYQQAKAFNATLRAGTAKVNYEEMQQHAGGGGGGYDDPDGGNDLDA